MSHLILLCGQGGIGKNSYAQYFSKLTTASSAIIDARQLSKQATGKVKMSTLVAHEIDAVEDTDYIFVCSANSSKKARKDILSKLKDKNRFYLDVVSLRTGTGSIIEYEKNNLNRELTAQEINTINSIYDSFEKPSQLEFINDGYKFVRTFEVDKLSSFPFLKNI